MISMYGEEDEVFGSEMDRTKIRSLRHGVAVLRDELAEVLVERNEAVDVVRRFMAAYNGPLEAWDSVWEDARELVAEHDRRMRGRRGKG